MSISEKSSGNWAVVFSVLAITLLQVLILRFEGRPWWCKCGELNLWISDVYSEHTSQHLFDPYSFSHVLHGFLFWWLLSWLAPRLALGWRLVFALALETGWEILENSHWVIERYRNTTAAVGYSGDTITNALGDLASAGLGFWIARLAGWQWTLAMFIAVELILLATIRDNLTLNVLMLFNKLPGLKEWQLGTG